MTTQRRRAISGAVSTAVAMSFSGRNAVGQSQFGKPRVMEGPMIGAVGPDRATIWARVNDAHPVRIIATDVASGAAVTSPVALARAEDDFTVRVDVAGLKPGTRYRYQIQVDGAADPYVAAGPEPAFRTAPDPATASAFKVAFGSCARYQSDREQRIWNAVAAASPDLFLWLGDNVYVDSLNPASFAEEYRRQRAVASLQPLLRSVPQLAIWDDHDYGLNNHDRTNPIKVTAFAAFKQYWANPAYGRDDAAGVFFSYTYGGVDFFFLDVRTWRDPNAAPDGPGKTMLGEVQREWLMAGLKGSRAPFKVLLSGSGWSAAKGSTGDSWAAFMTERDALFAFIQREKIGGVVLLSGDTHVGELNCIPWSKKGGYDFYDLVSSPLAQATDASWLERRPEARIRPVFFTDANFGLLSFDLRGRPKLSFTVVDTAGAFGWTPLELTVDDLANGVESWRGKIDRAALRGYEHLMQEAL